jgi:hypothetical protein
MKQQKLNKPYEGDDIKDFVNMNKTHSSPSRAFKDARYAEWIESDPDMSDMRLFVTELLSFAVPLIVMASIVGFLIFKIVSSK